MGGGLHPVWGSLCWPVSHLGLGRLHWLSGDLQRPVDGVELLWELARGQPPAGTPTLQPSAPPGSPL